MHPWLEHLQASLPSNPDILGRDKYFNAAVLISIVQFPDGPHFLFEKRQPWIRQGGEVCFPGGGFDGGDLTFERTAIRETVEELGIPEEKIRILGRVDTIVASLGTVVEGYVGLLDIGSLEELSPSLEEVERVFTVPFRHFLEREPQTYHVRTEIHPTMVDAQGREKVIFPAKELGLPQRYHQTWGGTLQRIHLYHTPEGIIWGITAELVKEVLDFLPVE
ncbi:NUDIX hydrolase [Anaerotalea alkaliphila]|uniref:NUDIX domain-containing protein n=1 Tax=Anaerotalea alkaliphila TaxID=2662126 RepID=A0A7X5HVE4_9FIRM|nr:NUDIX domain-containing protein [Anaerotalea alkaliphila]NDL67362.1 NUDIX domain-containing protein [Anaerotalea alkaliphila]